MILTEEQRGAIMYAISSLEQCDSEPEDPVVAKILGAMIDSSDQFGEVTKLIPGVDLAAARAALAGALKPGGYPDQETARIIHTHMPSLLAEIERLRAENAWLKSDREFQSEEIKRLEDELENYGDHYACLLISKDAQIMELEGMLSIRTEELDIAHSVARSEKEMHEKELAAFARRIKELEDTLVEERARVITSHPLTHVIDEDRTEAIMQLQAEGKIGPDAETGNRDHVVGPDQMVPNGKVWQITEERKTMLSHCFEVVDYVATTKAYSDAIRDRDTIRAMLEENL